MSSARERASGVAVAAAQRELPLFKLDRERLCDRTMAILKRDHRGVANAIGMAELYSAVFNEGWTNRINDTRGIRTIIEELRDAQHPICSGPNGYYLPADAAELIEYRRRRLQRKLREFVRDGKTCGAALPELQGQLALEWGEP